MRTFDALAAGYIRDLQARNASLATIATYEQSFTTFRIFLHMTGGSQELIELTSDVVRAYQVWLRETPLPRVYKGTTVRSIGGVHTKVRQLRALVHFGEAEGMITHRVKVTAPKLPERPFEVFSETDLRTIFGSRYLTGNSEGAIRNRALFGLLLDTGLRVGETASLEVCDLYLDDRLVRVTGKGDKTRFVPYSPLIGARLTEWLDVRGRHPGTVFELKVGGIGAVVRGLTNEATPTKLFWYKAGPWKRIIVTSDVVTHNFPAPHSDFLTQYIDYQVPPEKFDEIARFDGSCLLDRTSGEVAARCDSEAANTITLNLMHDIVTGKTVVEEARKTFGEIMVAYTLGRSAPYAESLQFTVPEGGTEDKDERVIDAATLGQQTVGKVKDVLTGGGEGSSSK